MRKHVGKDKRSRCCPYSQPIRASVTHLLLLLSLSDLLSDLSLRAHMEAQHNTQQGLPVSACLVVVGLYADMGELRTSIPVTAATAHCLPHPGPPQSSHTTYLHRGCCCVIAVTVPYRVVMLRATDCDTDVRTS